MKFDIINNIDFTYMNFIIVIFILADVASIIHYTKYNHKPCANKSVLYKHGKDLIELFINIENTIKNVILKYKIILLT